MLVDSVAWWDRTLENSTKQIRDRLCDYLSRPGTPTNVTALVTEANIDIPTASHGIRRPARE